MTIKISHSLQTINWAQKKGKLFRGRDQGLGEKGHMCGHYTEFIAEPGSKFQGQKACESSLTDHHLLKASPIPKAGPGPYS